jgi:hypothetical protein
MTSIEYFLQSVSDQRERIQSVAYDASRSLGEARFFEAKKQETFNNSFYEQALTEDIASCGRTALQGKRRIVEGLAVASIGVAMGAEWVYQIVTGNPRDLSYLNQLGALGQMAKYGVWILGNRIIEPIIASLPLIAGFGYASDVPLSERKWRKFFRSQARAMEKPIEVPLTKENVNGLEEEMARFEKECGKIDFHDLSDESIHPDRYVVRID